MASRWQSTAISSGWLEYKNLFAVTTAQFAPLHGPPVALFPFDDAHSTTQIHALVTSKHLRNAASAAGFRLRLDDGRCASALIR
jgi:hypothetical protein